MHFTTPFIEMRFAHRGLACVVIVTQLGHRCGYVAVPPDHPWHGTNYHPRKSGSDWETDLDHPILNVSVHGGLTFAEPKLYLEAGVSEPNPWWFGFDCAHHGDAPDLTLVAADSDTQASIHARMMVSFGGTVRSLDYVASECRSLADQLHAASVK